MSQPKPRRIWCESCEEETVHRSPGENRVKVPVWECSRDECDHSTSGFFTGAKTVEIAADGGDPDAE